jgi:hypothetical protein
MSDLFHLIHIKWFAEVSINSILPGDLFVKILV